MTARVYLAGPEIFLANARELGIRKRAICERYGLIGVFPADEEDPCDPSLTLRERGLAISRAMERVMRSCDAMIVNLTPFRGPSADVGSAYEMGFMRALGRPIFANTNDDRLFFDRVVDFCGGTMREQTTGRHEHSGHRTLHPARQPHARRRRHRLGRPSHCHARAVSRTVYRPRGIRTLRRRDRRRVALH